MRRSASTPVLAASTTSTTLVLLYSSFVLLLLLLLLFFFFFLLFLLLLVFAGGEQQLTVLGMVLAAKRFSQRGTDVVGTNRVTASFSFFARGTFWVLPLTYFYLPKSARAYLFPQSVKIHYFCIGPMNIDPICQDSSKGGAVETGCSELYGVIY